MNKDLVYWGIGKIGKDCINYFPEKKPKFIIDSYCKNKEYKGIRILKPEDVTDWNTVYIVITVKENLSIKEMLAGKKLTERENFEDYRSFFNIQDNTTEKNIERLKNITFLNRDLKKRILIFAPAFTARQSETLTGFLRQYSKLKKCVLIDNWGVMTEQTAFEKTGFPSFKCAEIPEWEKYKSLADKNERIKDILLKPEEEEWLASLSSRKNKKDAAEKTEYMIWVYQYWKEIIKMFEPEKVIIWGCWTSNSYMLGYLCEMFHIPYTYMEHGWLPGTYQFDPRGIAGQSEYAGISNPEIEIDREKIERIKNYIITEKLDSGSFESDPEDEINFKALDAADKTVFLVGMGDFSMGINPESSYWKSYVSPVVSSTEDAYLCLSEICQKYGWNFIFKPHPGETDINTDRPNEFHFHNMQIDRLIERSDVVVSISSAVNYKVLLYKKPLVQIGITSLTGKSCCYEVMNKEEIEKSILCALENGMTEPQQINYDRHLTMLLDNYLWDDLSEREVRYGLSLESDFPFQMPEVQASEAEGWY